jgi:hypothetical protein
MDFVSMAYARLLVAATCGETEFSVVLPRFIIGPKLAPPSVLFLYRIPRFPKLSSVHTLTRRTGYRLPNRVCVMSVVSIPT